MREEWVTIRRNDAYNSIIKKQDEILQSRHILGEGKTAKATLHLLKF